MIEIALATEDELSEEVGLRLSAEVGLPVGIRLRKGGNGYLRSRTPNFCQMSFHIPVILITDLDQMACPSELIAGWLRAQHHHIDMVFRVAVREIEAWVMADRDALASLFGVRANIIPRDPDSLDDAKAVLLQLAGRAPAALRRDLLPSKGAITRQGLGYNYRLCEFIRTDWDPARAAASSTSLRRARERISELAERYPPVC